MEKLITVIAASCILLAASHLVELKAVTFHKNLKTLTPFDVYVNGSRPITKSPRQGGMNGTAFDDFNNGAPLPAIIVGVHSINISSGNQIDSIQVTYLLSNGSLFHAPTHGKPSHPPINITFGTDERIVKIEGKTNNQLVDQLTITTVGPAYERRVYGPFGITGQIEWSLEGHIIGFFGRSGDLLDSIGVYSMEVLKKSDLFGGTGGSEVDDNTDALIPPVVMIAEIQVTNAELIDSIQVVYRHFDGRVTTGNKFGEGTSGNISTIYFAEGEKIVQLDGKSGDNYVNQLTFITEKADGSEGRYGPYGKIGKHSFSIHGNILGFYGSSGLLIDKIGVYYI